VVAEATDEEEAVVAVQGDEVALEPAVAATKLLAAALLLAEDQCQKLELLRIAVVSQETT